MLKKWVLIKKIFSITMVFSLMICLITTSSYAAENPGVIRKRSNWYEIVLPCTKGSYAIDKGVSTVISLKHPVIGGIGQLVDSSYNIKLDNSSIKAANSAINDLIKEGAIKAITTESNKKIISRLGLISNVKTVATTYKDIIKNLKNDTTDYQVNIAISRYGSLWSKSKAGAIAKYHHAKGVLTELRNSGHMKVTMAKPWESTLRTQISFTKYGKNQLNKMQKDLQMIEARFVSKKIK